MTVKNTTNNKDTSEKVLSVNVPYYLAILNLHGRLITHLDNKFIPCHNSNSVSHKNIYIEVVVQSVSSVGAMNNEGE